MQYSEVGLELYMQPYPRAKKVICLVSPKKCIYINVLITARSHTPSDHLLWPPRGELLRQRLPRPQQGLEALPQHLAPLLERGGQDALEASLVNPRALA